MVVKMASHSPFLFSVLLGSAFPDCGLAVWLSLANGATANEASEMPEHWGWFSCCPWKPRGHHVKKPGLVCCGVRESLQLTLSLAPGVRGLSCFSLVVKPSQTRCTVLPTHRTVRNDFLLWSYKFWGHLLPGESCVTDHNQVPCYFSPLSFVMRDIVP